VVLKEQGSSNKTGKVSLEPGASKTERSNWDMVLKIDRGPRKKHCLNKKEEFTSVTGLKSEQ
jgi:hypothetical protein